MIKSALKFALCVSLSLHAVVSFAQDDAEGCKDYPAFNRMPNYYLSSCGQKEFGLLQFPVGKPDPDNENKIKSTDVEGKIFVYNYLLKEGATEASGMQIMRNFQNGLKTKGATILAEYPNWCGGYYTYNGELGDGGIPFGNGCVNWSTTMKFKSEGKEVWVYLQKNDGGYDIAVAEREEMKQDIKASEMLTALNKDGYIALYINFETGKADIKTESQPIIEQIVQLLQSNPSLKISVEGHTDDSGTPQSNQVLSEKRAASVMNAVIAKNIDKTRIKSKGWGQTKPLADNRTEEGKAKNRRVEIVKQ